jgi:hypothetical protein
VYQNDELVIVKDTHGTYWGLGTDEHGILGPGENDGKTFKKIEIFLPLKQTGPALKRFSCFHCGSEAHFKSSSELNCQYICQLSCLL